MQVNTTKTMKTIPLQELLAKATPGPWHYRNLFGTHTVIGPGGYLICETHPKFANPKKHEANNLLLAHAANHIGPLVEALEELLATHPQARAYPDGPSIEKGMRDELKRILAAAKNVEVGT